MSRLRPTEVRGQGLLSHAGGLGAAFTVADTAMGWEGPLSDDYQERRKGNLEVGGGQRIRWNDRNHCCQGFLKMRLQREDREVQIQTFFPKKELGKQRTWEKSEIQRRGKSNRSKVKGWV